LRQSVGLRDICEDAVPEMQHVLDVGGGWETWPGRPRRLDGLPGQRCGRPRFGAQDLMPV
ncbi:ATP-dependent RNA helicase RhlB, partial [Clarias magur]